MYTENLWVKRNISDSEASKLSREAGISTLVAKVLLSRGIDEPASVRRFLEPSLADIYDPLMMHGMDRAVQRIVKALRNREKIVLYGDYDVDGITGVSILYDFLSNEGADVHFYIPDRLEEGYGLSAVTAERLTSMAPSLVVTVDCGITAVEEVRYLKEHGIDVIITDHHECANVLPCADALVNPCIPGCSYPFKDLAGVGVVFKLIHAICIETGKADEYRKYLDLAALGTVADVVPLIDENRVLVKHGMAEIPKTLNKGLRALIDISGLRDKPINSYDIGFVLAPRINAAGRIGSAHKAVKLFTTRDENEALSIAAELDEENRARQEIEADILKQAIDAIESEIDTRKEKVLVVCGDSWHHGVIGIVASRITEKYHRPCIILSREEEQCKGSGRSIEGFNLFKALDHCGSILEKYGGHELAAGLTLKQHNIIGFRKMINSYADTVLSEEILTPRIRIDAYIEQCEITFESVRELDSLAPFGVGNATPVFACCGMVIDDIRTVKDGKHLKLKLKEGSSVQEAIGFNMGNLAGSLGCGDIVDIAFNLGINTWNDMQTVQLNLKDIKHAGTGGERNVCRYSASDSNIGTGDEKEYGNFGNSGNVYAVYDTIPERSDLAAVYRYLRRSSSDSLVIDDLYDVARQINDGYKVNMNYYKVKKSIDIFEELRLLRKEKIGKHAMKITILSDGKDKVNLEDSSTYRKFQALKKTSG